MGSVCPPDVLQAPLETGQCVGAVPVPCPVQTGVAFGRRAPVDREQSKAIREWARGQGLEVSDRGRIPTSVTEAYQQAH